MNKVSSTIIFAILVTGIFAIAYHGTMRSTLSTAKYDEMDMADFADFEKLTRRDLRICVEQGVNSFIEDFSMVSYAWNSMKGDREKYLSELWDKHFIRPVASVVRDRVYSLVVAMDKNNMQCASDLSAIVKDVSPFEKKTRDTLKSALNRQGIRISSSSANSMILNEALAVGAGTGGYMLVSSLLKTNPYTIVISIITDFIVYAGTSHILEGELADKMKKEIQASMDSDLSSPNGFFANIKGEIDKFHHARLDEYRKLADGTNY